MKVFNLNSDPEWDRTEDREGWRIKDAWVGAHIDAELIGASMYEVEPGDKQGPFHTHHANEEWVIVLRGEPTLRTHEGERQLRGPRAPRGGGGPVFGDDGQPLPIWPPIVEYVVGPEPLHGPARRECHQSRDARRAITSGSCTSSSI